MANVSVEFTVTVGGGTVEPASAATDANGLASTELTLVRRRVSTRSRRYGRCVVSSLSTASPCRGDNG